MSPPARRPSSRTGADRPSTAPARARRLIGCSLAVVVVAVTALAASASPAVPATGAGASRPAAEAMSPLDAVVLGLIEGITEYLPVSSTGHLAVAQDLLGIGTGSAEEKEAADAYAVVIQAGAILAVVVLYWRRLVSLLHGLLGRDETGRRVLIATVIAVAPIAAVGLVLESMIKEHLFGIGPVIVAWVLGGAVLLALSRRGWWSSGSEGGGAATGRHAAAGGPLDMIVPRQAIIIGAAQCLALWPGTSRSLVTIVAGLAVGLSLAAAVEFSFLMGLVTLSAATLVDGAQHGGGILDAFGWANPALGFAVAFVAAVAAVRWMVSYLQGHSLAVFGWYRLGAAGVVGLLWASGAV